ncbi:MAG: hypothetical protein QOG69_644 [Actinomycetota bacterium]|nr:hypothetical protein [Actinomycetota bacterium]
MSRSGHGRLCVLPTLWPPVLSALSLFAFAFVTNAVWPQLVGCALVGLVASSLIAVARPPRIDVRIDLPDRVLVGEPFETTLHIRQAGAGPSRPLVVRHRLLSTRRLVPDYATLVGTLPGHDEVVLRIGRTPVARGAIERSQVELDAVAPFGFFARRTIVPVPQALLVLPALTPALPLPIATGARSGVAGRTNGLDAAAVRDWRPGDQVRNVQWRSTARTGRLTVLEREDVSAGSLVILVLGRTGDRDFEFALAKAAATGVAALRQGMATVVMTSDGEIACSHPRTERALLEFFARINRATTMDDALLARALGIAGREGSLVLAASSATPAAWRTNLRSLSSRAGVRLIDLADRAPVRTAQPGRTSQP